MEEINRRQGQVYVFENENGLVKVGVSLSPLFRKFQIENIGGYKISRQYCTKNCWNPYKIEAFVHKLLAEKRKQNEWFFCTFEEAKAAVDGVFKISAIIEYDAPEPDYSWIEEMLNEFYIKPFIPDYGKTDAEKINQLEKFLGNKIDLEYFNSCIELWEELNEAEQVNQLKVRFPNLASGKYNEKEIVQFAMETYSDLSHTKFCDLWAL